MKPNEVDGEFLRSNLEQIRRARVRLAIKCACGHASDNYYDEQLNSEYGQAVSAMSRSALRHVEQNLISSTEIETQFSDLLEAGVKFVDRMHTAFRSMEYSSSGCSLNRISRDKLNLWSHRGSPLDEPAVKIYADYKRPNVSEWITDYLELPYRCAQIERILIDASMAMYIFRLGSIMIEEFHKISIDGFDIRDSYDVILNKKVEMNVKVNENIIFNGSLLIFVFFGVLDFFAYLISSNYMYHEIENFLLIVTYLTISVLISLLLWTRYADSKYVNKCRKIMNAKLYCYAQLGSNDPIDPRKFLSRLQSSETKGAVWPTEIQILLEDIIGRKVSF